MNDMHKSHMQICKVCHLQNLIFFKSRDTIKANIVTIKRIKLE